MKVTIDSSEPLAETLRVIGAMYNINLAVIEQRDEGEAPDKARVRESVASKRRSSGQSAQGSMRSSAKTASRRSGRKAQSVSVADMRSWAQSNGHTVNARGTLPASVKAAYAEAHSA